MMPALAAAAMACLLTVELLTYDSAALSTAAAWAKEQAGDKDKPPTEKEGKKAPKKQKGKKAKPKGKPLYPLQPNPLAGCSICHVDVEDEYVGSMHFKKKVGCQTCHGPSKGHVADENNEVKPDHVFNRKSIDNFCTHCHHCKRPQAKKRALTKGKKLSSKRKVCTDCHGHHDLKLKQTDVRPVGKPAPR